MRLSDVKQQLRQQSVLDDRMLFAYATAAGTLQGDSFQNLMGIAFGPEQLTLYAAKTDGSIGKRLLELPYSAITGFRMKHRFLYSYTELAVADTSLRFYNYDKKVFLRGFADAGLEGRA